MFFNPKIIALTIAFFISISVMLAITFLQLLPLLVTIYLSVFILIITGSTLYFLLHYYIFKEINNFNVLLQNIKSEEYALDFNKIIYRNDNPLTKIKKDIAEFAEKKKQEIDELKKLETFRREFLADVSHELKTPIFAAQGFVHTLLDGAIDDLQVRDRFLHKAANSLEGLNVLVADLLTISQMEIGEIKMNFQHFDLHLLIVTLFEQLNEFSKTRATRMRFSRDTPKSCYVYADKFRIAQALSNLLLNAIKYGKEKGLILVSLTYEADNVYVAIKDEGPGIEQRHLHRIFERFYRVDRSRSKDRGGTGLGLAIVKHIIEAHNASVYVSSKIGDGTIFSFKLKKGKVINEKG